MKRPITSFIIILSYFAIFTFILHSNDIQSLQTEESKILTVYFSCDSSNTIDQLITSATPEIENTKKLAEIIQQEIGGDLFPITTSEKYENNYHSVLEQSKNEKEKNLRPKLAAIIENMDSYDTVIIAFPNWWHTIPMPVFTFLESYDFSHKTIIPICTHGGGGIGNSMEDIMEASPPAVVTQGLAVNGYQINNAKETTTNFIKNILNKKIKGE